MERLELGDVFEINTNKGKAYFQCVKIDKLTWYVVKVFNQLFDERPTLKTIADIQDNYFVGFSLSIALKRNLVEKIGNIPLEPDFNLPKHMRSSHNIRGQHLGWHIIDTVTWERQLVEKLSEEQMQLSPWGVWNDILLKENLESGWNLSNWN